MEWGASQGHMTMLGRPRPTQALIKKLFSIANTQRYGLGRMSPTDISAFWWRGTLMGEAVYPRVLARCWERGWAKEMFATKTNVSMSGELAPFCQDCIAFDDLYSSLVWRNFTPMVPRVNNEADDLRKWNVFRHVWPAYRHSSVFYTHP